MFKKQNLRRAMVPVISFMICISMPWTHRIMFDNMMAALPGLNEGWAHFLVVAMSGIVVALVATAMW